MILFTVVTIVLTILAIVYPRQHVQSAGYFERPGYVGLPLWVLFLVSGILLAILLVVWLLSHKASKNYYICLTDKRIIIRHGVFTTNYKYYAIDKVSGNITINCQQSIFERNTNCCALYLEIELLPVGHTGLRIWLPSIVDGYEFSKKIDAQIKENSATAKAITTKE